MRSTEKVLKQMHQALDDKITADMSEDDINRLLDEYMKKQNEIQSRGGFRPFSIEELASCYLDNRDVILSNTMYFVWADKKIQGMKAVK